MIDMPDLLLDTLFAELVTAVSDLMISSMGVDTLPSISYGAGWRGCGASSVVAAA